MSHVRRIARSLSSLVVGYLLLAAANMGFVMAWFVQPIADASLLAVLALAVPYTAVASFGVGFLTAWIAGWREQTHAAVLAACMALVVLGSFALDVSVEPDAYKAVYLVVMVPGTVLGGRLRGRRSGGGA